MEQRDSYTNNKTEQLANELLQGHVAFQLLYLFFGISSPHHFPFFSRTVRRRTFHRGRAAFRALCTPGTLRAHDPSRRAHKIVCCILVLPSIQHRLRSTGKARQTLSQRKFQEQSPLLGQPPGGHPPLTSSSNGAAGLAASSSDHVVWSRDCPRPAVLSLVLVGGPSRPLGHSVPATPAVSRLQTSLQAAAVAFLLRRIRLWGLRLLQCGTRPEDREALLVFGRATTARLVL